MSRPHPGAVAAADQMRAEARDQLRQAPLYVVSLGHEDGQQVLGSLLGLESHSLGFLLGTIVSLWEWLGELSEESDAEIARRVLLAVAERRAARDERGDAAEEE